MSSNRKSEWESMSVDDLLALREQVKEVLRAKLKAKQAEFERQLRALGYPSAGVVPAKGAQSTLD